jgi:hypothetical protein
MDPRYDRYGAQWAPQPAAYGPPPADDTWIRVAGYAMAGVAVMLVAAVALAVAGVLYGLATWRRWRWWVLALAGLAGVAIVAVLYGPEGAWMHHTTGIRALGDPAPGGPSLGALVATHWAQWLVAQVPLSLPAGALVAALVRCHVETTAAHELSPGAVARRQREERSRSRAAVRRARRAPLVHKGQPVLGAWADGDLPWRSGAWCTIPTLGLGKVVLGLPGSGKTETLLRLAQLGLASGYDVHVLDAKGEMSTQARFAELASSMGLEVRLFPQAPYDGWRGNPDVLRNRLGQIIDYTEPFYEDGAGDILDAILTRPSGPPRSWPALVGALEAVAENTTPLKGVNRDTREGTLSRYRRFAASARGGLDGTWAFEDTRASYLLLDGLVLGKDAPRLARFFIEDFAHYASARKDPDRKALLLVDEFSALRLPNAAALLERLRSFGAGVVVAAQSYEGLHDDDNERARLLNAASTIIAHRMSDPDPVTARAGTIRRPERSHQLDAIGPTGQGSLRLQDAFRIDPNDLRSLPPGMAYVISGGRAARVAVARAATVIGKDLRPEATTAEVKGDASGGAGRTDLTLGSGPDDEEPGGPAVAQGPGATPDPPAGGGEVVELRGDGPPEADEEEWVA